MSSAALIAIGTGTDRSCGKAAPRSGDPPDAARKPGGDDTRMTALVPDLDQVTVEHAMHAGVFTCAEDASLEAAAALMARYSIHCVVVLEGPDDEKPWGIVSDLDLVSAAFDHDVADWTAGTAAGTPAVTIEADAPLRRAAQLMREYGISHLVVVDPGADTPLGVISTLDLARFVAGDQEDASSGRR
jgi:CBS domain-containing protein